MSPESTERDRILAEIKDLLQQNLEAIRNATFLGWTSSDRMAQEQRLERLLALGEMMGFPPR